MSVFLYTILSSSLISVEKLEAKILLPVVVSVLKISYNATPKLKTIFFMYYPNREELLKRVDIDTLIACYLPESD